MKRSRRNFYLLLLSLAWLLLPAACAPADGLAEGTRVTAVAQRLPTPLPSGTPPPETRAPTAVPAPFRAGLPDLGPAPAWANDTWINSDPLTLADLRGKVVLLEFWTYG